MRQNHPVQGLENTLVLPKGMMPQVLLVGMMPQISFVHPAFGVGPTFYMPPTTLIRRPEGMLSSPLGQHILDYEPSRGFVIPYFSMFDGSANPYDHMLHYNQAMTVCYVRYSWLACGGLR